METYYESAEGIKITHGRALKELEKHGLQNDLGDFYQDLSKKDFYDAQTVLAWLGY